VESPGRMYRMNVDTLVPEAIDPSGSLQIIAGRGWLQFSGSDGQLITAELKEDGLRELDGTAGTVQRIVEYNGEAWLLTNSGAHRYVLDAAERFEVPPTLYHSLVAEANGFWLLDSRSAVRIAGGATAVFSTGQHTPADIRQVCGETWILTGRKEFGAIKDIGPAYLISGNRTRAIGPTEGGVSDVVDIYGVPWLLTQQSGRPGQMMRATH
jgi:hypothetical protein